MVRRSWNAGRPGVFDEGKLVRWLEGQGLDGERTLSKVNRAMVRGVRDFVVPASGQGPESESLSSSSPEVQKAIWEAAEAFAKRPQLALSQKVMKGLREEFVLFTTVAESVVVSKEGDATKCVVVLHDGERVESVSMRHCDEAADPTRTTVCVSSQIGCQMGCKFCATGTMGIIGDLSACEIIEQVAHATINERLGGREAPKNVVFMGMGEPLNNYDNVCSAVEALTASGSWELRRKSVTISTVGVVPSFRRLTREMPEVQVALSLHAPTQELREQIVPAAKAWPLNQLMNALDEHLSTNRKRYSTSSKGLMVEYVLLAGVNDTDEHADQLVELLKDRCVMVNIIPYNPNVTAELYGYEKPSIEASKRFGKRMIDAGLHVRLRKEFGSDIAAACGQLALVSSSPPNSSTISKDIEDTVQPIGRENKKKKPPTTRSGANLSAPSAASEAVEKPTKTFNVVINLTFVVAMTLFFGFYWQQQIRNR